jgi:hypothetical protein
MLRSNMWQGTTILCRREGLQLLGVLDLLQVCVMLPGLKRRFGATKSV